MAIDFTSVVRDGILYVTTKGKDESLEEVQEYGYKLLQAALKAECSKVLCDERELIYDLETFDTYQLGKSISEIVPALARIAIVCRPEFKSEAEFWETVVVNRGLSVKMCQSLDEAEKWLLKII